METAKGRPVALIFNYSCHPTTVSTDIYEVSADYPGVAQREIERFYPGAMALFVNGCAGDIRPAIKKAGRFVGGTFEDVERMGRLLAAEVAEASDAAQPFKAETVRGMLKRHPLPLDRTRLPRDPKHLDDLCREYLRRYPVLRRRADVIARWKGFWGDALRTNRRVPLSLPVDLQVLRVGDAFLVGTPGEPMVEAGIQIKDRLRRYRMVIGYVNGRTGPIPSARNVREAVPETMYFLYYLYPAPFSERAQDTLVRTLVRMAESL